MPIFNANAIPDLLSSDNDGNIEHKPIVIEQHEPFCLFNTHLVCWLWVKMHFFFFFLQLQLHIFKAATALNAFKARGKMTAVHLKTGMN